EKILDLIYAPDTGERHRDICRKRQTGTGELFLGQHEFENWRDRKTCGEKCFSSVLSCSGIPGAGKSFMCSLVIDHLTATFAQDPHVCVAYLYCDYGDDMTKTSEMMLCAFLKQGVEKLSDTESIHRDPSISLRKLLQRKPPFQLKLEETCQLLVQTIKRFQRFYICIDAMDECHYEIVRLLLNYADVLINLQNKYCRSALSIAVDNGHDAIVQLLLERNDIHLNPVDDEGDTPLLRAVSGGHDSIVSLL
ncbi:hypothetical protein FPQ18DRAFT_238520, partial [Pyronema domesticum]